MPLNINIPSANFSLGPDSGFFYHVSNTLNALVKVEADGTVVQTFPVQRSRLQNTVTELHFDGSHFWTMEDLPSDLGVVIKKWRLTPEQNAQGLPAGVFPVPAQNAFTWQDEMTLWNETLKRYVSNAFCVEHYHKQLNGNFNQGESSIQLNDVSNLSPGDIIFIGPSTVAGFVGFGEDSLVTNVDQATKTVTLGKAAGLDNRYSSTDPVSFTKSIFIFNDHTFSGLEDREGLLIRYAWPDRTIISTSGGMRYFGVNASDFDGTSVFWIRADQILEASVAASSFIIVSSNESNLRESDLTTIIDVPDMISDLDNNQHLKLQQKETVEDVGAGTFATSNWSPLYNFQVQPILPIINSINTSTSTRRVLPFPAIDPILVAAEVRDQFNFPIFNETIQFSAALNAVSDAGSPGTFSPTQGVTNSSGIVNTVYSPSSTIDPILIDITAVIL